MAKNGTLVIGTSIDKKGFERDLKGLQSDVEKYGDIGADFYTSKDNLGIADEIADEITQGFEEAIYGGNIFEKMRGQIISSTGYFPEEVADGLLEGFNNGYDGARELTKEIADEISEDLSNGVKEGITNGVEEAQEEVEDFGGKTDSVFSKVFSKLGSKFKSTITRAIRSASSVGAVLVKILKVAGISAGALGIGIGAIVLLIGPLVAGIYIIIQAFKKVMEENEQLKVDLQYIVWAIQKALEPAVNYVAGIIVGILKTVIKIIQYVAVLIKMLTGHNIFDNASAQAFADHLAEAKENADGVGGSLKQIKKQLAGFDEMNVLNDTNGGGGVGLGSESFVTPDFDLSDLTDAEKEIEKFNKDMADGYAQLKTLAKDTPIQDFIDDYGLYGIAIQGLAQYVYGQWEIWFGQWDIVGGFYDLIVSFFTGDEEGINKALDKIWGGVERWANGSQDRVWGILKIFGGLILGGLETNWNLLVGFLEGIGQWVLDNVLLPIWEDIEETFGPEIEFFKGIWDGIKEIIDGAKEVITNVVDTVWSNIEIMINNVKQLIDWAVQKAKEIIKPYVEWIKNNIINPIKDKFTEMWDKVVSKVQETVQKVKDKFQPVIDFFNNLISKIRTKFGEMGQQVGDAISSKFKSAINAVLSIAESILNNPIKSINKLIDKINAVPGINLTKLNTFSFPRLAKGGIVSMPGRGVPVGSAIAGERGQEAVLPLTDSQQMALLGEAIGKYITINANITNTMNGRVISRELQRINNESDFSYNR